MTSASGSEDRIVYIIDDDRDVRISLGMLLRSRALASRPFASAEDFIDEYPSLAAGCIMLDITMPGKDGLSLLADLRASGCEWPVIMMTGHSEVRAAVRAMKLGAIEFLEKPFEEADLGETLEECFSLLAQAGQRSAEATRARAILAALSPRERHVLQLVVEGLPNKLIAHRLDLSIRTIEMHRASLMKSVQGRNTVDLMRFAATAGVIDGSLDVGVQPTAK